jgi:hypothetical protein
MPYAWFKCMSAKATQCMKHAAHCRELARRAGVSPSHQDFLELARRWQCLAEELLESPGADLTNRLCQTPASGPQRKPKLCSE